jgi:NitT/TauT family transport system permease protein
MTTNPAALDREVEHPIPSYRSMVSARTLQLIRTTVPPLIAILLAVVAWQLVVWLADTPEYILPSPGKTLDVMFEQREYFLTEGMSTLVAVLLGFGGALAISIPLAVLMVYSNGLRKAIYPLVIAAQVIPKVALAPVFIIWLGFGVMPKVLMVILISFFPMIIDSVVGLSAARADNLMLVRSMGASRWQAFWKVRWPWALPSIFAGAKVGITLALIGAVVAELFGSNNGLGVILVTARGTLDTPTVFAAIGWLTMLGFVLFGAVALIERLVTPHHRSLRGKTDEMSGHL